MDHDSDHDPLPGHRANLNSQLQFQATRPFREVPETDVGAILSTILGYARSQSIQSVQEQ